MPPPSALSRMGPCTGLCQITLVHKADFVSYNNTGETTEGP